MPERMLEWNEPKKLYSQENTGDGFFFSVVVDMWVYSFSRKRLHHGCFTMKIGKF